MKKRIAIISIISSVALSGCAVGFKSAREKSLEGQVDQLAGRIAETEKSRQILLGQIDKLQDELRRANDQRSREVRELTEEKERAARLSAAEQAEESSGMVEAQRRLAESLKKELGDARAKLEMTERGLVLTFLDEIFFDSGKAVVKQEGAPTLQKVSVVLKETVPDSLVAVEGHTDNEPIRYSGWKSNWELSSARALAVVHYLTESQDLTPERLRAVGFGEYHPVSSNDTLEGRRQNRRVEVVILPPTLKKEKLNKEAKALDE